MFVLTRVYCIRSPGVRTNENILYSLICKQFHKIHSIWSPEITKETLQKLPECFQKLTKIRNSGYGPGSFISNGPQQKFSARVQLWIGSLGDK